MIDRGDLFKTAVGATYRLLAVTRSVKGDIVHVLGMDTKNPLPEQWKLQTLTEGLKNGLFERISMRGRSIVVTTRGDSSQGADKTPAQKLADSRWSLIEHLVKDERILWRKSRGPLVADLAKARGVSEQTIMTSLRLFWRGGMTKDALLGSFSRCGIPKDGTVPTNRGRMPRNGRYEKFQWSGDAEKKRVLATARRFFKDKKTNSRRFIYRRVVAAHYSAIGADGIKRELPLGQRPTASQVLYLLDRDLTLEAVLRRSHGDDNFENNIQPKTGSARDYANGIGQYYEIDSTIPDIWIYAEDDPSVVIGKATLYLIVDVFSRLIVGFHLTLDKPSWTGAMEAMMSLVEDKEALCARWDFPYRPEDWVGHGYWPQFFRADRGSEMLGFDSDAIAETLQAGIINVPARRAPYKGTVECSFKLTQVPLKEHAAGYTPPADIGRRQTDDHKGSAARTLKSVGQEILAAKNLYNAKIHTGIELPARDVYKGVQPIPNVLWQRDYESRAGELSRFDPDFLRFKLLPSDEFTVTPAGVFYAGLLWVPPKSERGTWLLPATRGFYKVRATFHRNLVDCIYVHDRKDPTKWTTMQLADRCLQYAGRSFAEMKHLQLARLTLKELADEHNLSLELAYDREAAERNRAAIAEAKVALAVAKGRSRTSSATAKRANEALRNRARTPVLATTASTQAASESDTSGAREQREAQPGAGAGVPPPKPVATSPYEALLRLKGNS